MNTGVDALERSLEKTCAWLDEILEDCGWDDRQRAYSGLRAVLHALRDRLTPDEAFHLAAELPMVLRGMYIEGWDPRRTPSIARTREEFLAGVAERLAGLPEIDPERITRSVFRRLAEHVSGGEVADVAQMLPESVRDLWPSLAERQEISPEGRQGLPPGGRLPRRGSSGDERRALVRQAKREIRESLARARAAGARPQDLPVLLSARKARRTARGRTSRRPDRLSD